MIMLVDSSAAASVVASAPVLERLALATKP